MPASPALPPSRPAGRRGRSLVLPLLLAVAVAALALTAALTGPSSPADVRGAADTSTPDRPTAAATPTSASASVPVPTPLPPTSLSSPAAPSPTPTPPSATSAPAPVPLPSPAPGPPPSSGPAPAPPPVAAGAPAPTAEGQVLELVNAERAAAGCSAVRADDGLAGVARRHSADMRDRGYFSHTDPEGRSPFDRAAAAGVGSARAENIAAGQPDAAAVMAAWMASPGHRANILDCSLSSLGVGVSTGAGGPWWTQLFG